MRRTLLLLTTMVTGVLLVSGVAYALTFTCDSVDDQDPDPGECQGTPDADRIDGTLEGAEVIRALAGNDKVDGFGGRDEVYGGRGNDVVDGWHSSDTIYGGSGDDGSAEGTTFKTPTKDTTNLEGGEDSDKVYGGEGDDWIDAAAHDLSTDNPGSVDRSYGEEGNDRIYAIDGNEDIIDCGPGTNDLVRRDVGIDTTTGCEERRSQ
jgi:Ca2+-binding RTX toxin-like protein